MNKQSKKLLTVIFFAAIVGISGCITTTTHRLGSSQAALNHHEIGKDDAVLIRYANEGDSRSSSRSEIVQISNISDFGITGVGESGKAVNIAFTEIFQIEYKDVGLVEHDSPAAIAAGGALEITAKAVYVAACLLAGGGC
jgi:hypothetical protein